MSTAPIWLGVLGAVTLSGAFAAVLTFSVSVLTQRRAGGGRRAAQRAGRLPRHRDDLLDAPHRGHPVGAPARRGGARRRDRHRRAHADRVPLRRPRGPGDHPLPVDGGQGVGADGRAAGRRGDRDRRRGHPVLAALPQGGPPERGRVLQPDRDRAHRDRRRGARLRPRRPAGRRVAARPHLGRVRPDRAHRPGLLVGVDHHRHHRAVAEDDRPAGHRLARLPRGGHPRVRERGPHGPAGRPPPPASAGTAPPPQAPSAARPPAPPRPALAPPPPAPPRQPPALAASAPVPRQPAARRPASAAREPRVGARRRRPPVARGRSPGRRARARGRRDDRRAARRGDQRREHRDREQDRLRAGVVRPPSRAPRRSR